MNAPLNHAHTLTRRASITPNTFDLESRSVEAIISTFAPVNRIDRLGPYVERLDPSGLDTSALVGAPVLDGHRQASARDTIGVVTAFRMEDGQLVATIRLSKAADAEDVVTRIAEGTLSGVSVGYRVHKWTDSKSPDSKARIRTAAAWSIFEVSAVPIPADPGATFRGNPMSKNIEPIEPETIAPPAVEPDTIETRSAIRTIQRSAGLPVEWADTQIDTNASVVEARAAAFEEMQTRSQNTPRIRVVSSHENPNTIRERRADALYSRMSGEVPSDEVRPYMTESLRDMARASVEASGVSTRGMDADSLFRAAMHTTSDFPQLLTGTGNRTLVSAYKAAESPVKTMLARQATLSDFRPGSKLKLSDIGLLEKVSESGEITHTTRGETSESYSLDTYATQFGISRKALINDDLGAFRDWGQTAGRMAAETETNLLLSVLKSNPMMNEDGKALFHVDRGNTTSGSGIGIPELETARKALREMKGLDGKTPINAVPKYLVVGPQLETVAEQVLGNIMPATVDAVNPFSGRLTLLVEPRITDASWYVFADPANVPVLEYAYLSGAKGPQMASREGWDVLGMEFRVVLDFGAGAIDWRGAYLNEAA